MKKSTEFVLPRDLMIVGLDTDDDETHPLYDERAFLVVPKERVESYREHGCDEIVHAVRWDGVSYVVCGRQRTKAGRLANEGSDDPKPLQVNYHRIAQKDHLALTSLMVRENALREDLSPLDSGAMANRLAKLGQSPKQIASIFGVSPQAVKNWIKVDGFEPEVKAAVSEGRVSHYGAMKLFEKKDQGEQLALLDTLEEQTDEGEPTPGKPKAKKKLVDPKPKNMGKRYAKRMVSLEESPIDPKVLLGMRFMLGISTGAECSREIEGFKSALGEAKRFFKAKAAE